MHGALSLRSRRAGLLGFACAVACLDPNRDFDGPATTSGDSSTVEESSAADSGASSSDTDASCMPDGFEDATNPDYEAGLTSLGSYTATLEALDARDLYNYFVDGVGMGEFWLAADADVRVCVYVACDDDETQPPDCVEPATSSSSDNGVGCCGGSSVGLAFECPLQMGAKLHLLVDQPSQACLSYGFEIATSLP